IGVLIIIIVACIVFLVENRPQPGPAYEYSVKKQQANKAHSSSSTPSVGVTSSSDQTTQYVVSYTNNGFSPKTMQVPKGKSVKFVNNSDTALTIAADDQGSSLQN